MKYLLIILLLLTACTAEQKTAITAANEQLETAVNPVLEKTINTTESAVEAVQKKTEETKPIIEKKINETAIIAKAITTELNTTERRTSVSPDAIIGIGDSLTYGEGVPDKTKIWIARYAEGIKLYNYAVSGDTTYGARYSQLEAFKAQNIQGNKLVFLWIGANDITQLTPITDLEANYRYLVKTITGMENTTLIIMNIPDASKLGVAEAYQIQTDNYLAQYGVSVDVRILAREVLAQYNKLIQNIASEYYVQVIDMFNFLETFDSSVITADQFHPNEKGHQLIADKVKFIISKD